MGLPAIGVPESTGLCAAKELWLCRHGVEDAAKGAT